jgi:putative acetyltransferase
MTRRRDRSRIENIATRSSESAIMILRTATSAADWAVVHSLVREYAEWLGIDLCFQNFEHELANLAEMYGPPGGCMLLAENQSDGEIAIAGCVGLRRYDDATCEMKRLYVRPEHRNTGLGRRLVLAIMAQARALGYERMRLDTLDRMTEAQRLYRSVGFHPIPPYGVHPVPGTQFLEANLDPR